MAEDKTSTQPSIHKQDAHYLLKDMQKSIYMVPILSPHTALGVVLAQEIHDQTCATGNSNGRGFKILPLLWGLSQPALQNSPGGLF